MAPGRGCCAFIVRKKGGRSLFSSGKERPSARAGLSYRRAAALPILSGRAIGGENTRAPGGWLFARGRVSPEGACKTRRVSSSIDSRAGGPAGGPYLRPPRCVTHQFSCPREKRVRRRGGAARSSISELRRGRRGGGTRIFPARRRGSAGGAAKRPKRRAPAAPPPTIN